MKQKVAFFDIDGTVFRSSLFIELVEKLITKDVFPTDTRGEYEKVYQAWLNREGSYETYIDAMIETFYNHIKGVHYGIVADLGREVVASHSKRVYRYTRDLIAELKEDNYFIVAISQSPKAILNDFCNEYGFDKVYGRMYEVGPTDCFTGVVIDEHIIQNKANIIKRVFETEEVTTEGSVAVGDTEGDIPMLESVARPICFNPNKSLYDYAKIRRWDTIVERKDVIYEL
ncbi:MAG: HAD superfamily hydrolase (TIGR01490 family) [Acidimicrobiales bacterium]|jgi:HAD superfamily hydrolase (TIGR01490 family)